MKVFDNWTEWRSVEEALGGRVSPDELAFLHNAFEFAVRWHGDQVRPGGAPYVQHLLQAVEILVEGSGITTRDVLAAAFLHDVVEDTSCTLDEVRESFGSAVADLVKWVTKPDAATDADKENARLRYLRSLASAPTDALLVKLADRLSNVQRLDTHPRSQKRRSYYKETVQWIVPLAVGIPWFDEQFIAWQNEFSYLNRNWAQPARPRGLRQ